MNPLLSRLDSATRLTKSGDLRAATQAIQEALKVWPGAQRSGSPAKPIQVSAVLLDSAAPIRNSKERPLLLEYEANVRSPDPRVESPGFEYVSGAFLRGRYSDDSGARDYRLFVPPVCDARALPLIVMLHGCTQDPDSFALGTGMNDAAVDTGFFVLYPAQPQSANANRCWNWFEPAHQRRGHGEPALIVGMIRHVMAKFRIDPNRVYVAGLSAGGAMAVVLGETYPDVFAAVGVHSGLPTGVAKDVASAFVAMKGPAARVHLQRGKSGASTAGMERSASVSRVPTIVFHGDRDTTVHAANGRQITERVIGTSFESTAAQERARAPGGREYTRKVNRDASGQVVSEHWTVHGGAHAWFGGRLEGSHTDPKGPDATQAMVLFFLLHSKK
jgi:poly(hydroxyalkanoate) depolymerase family esterase